MVKDEVNYLKFFESVCSELQETLDEAIEDNEFLGSMNFGIFQPYKSIENLDQAITDSLRALKLGVAIEDKSIAFYSQCKEKISSGSTKKEFDKIIAQEKKHKTMFEEKIKDFK